MATSAQRVAPPRRTLPKALRDELERVSRTLLPSTARDRHVAALGEPDLGVVVTGQQVGLFLGPAYSFYKAATSVVHARRLAEVTGRPIVPVFWLQSEDHDADEVASCRVLNEADEVVDVTLQPTGPARASLGERVLGSGVTEALASLDAALDGALHRAESCDLLARSYRADAGWTQAFAQLLGEVFAEEGLLVFDPRAPAVADLARPIHRRAFAHADEVERALAAGAAILEEAGEPVGVEPRPGVSASFFHPEGADGPRFRLERTKGGWRVPGGDVLTRDELLARLESEPRTFSTSCMLRVALQNTLFPVEAQVAGPGEAHYLRQAPPLCTALDAPEAPVVPRARIAIVDQRCRRRLDALGLSAGDVNDRDTLLRRLAKDDAGLTGQAVTTRLLQAFESALDDMRAPLERLDERAVERTEKHVHKGVNKLGRRIDDARARRDTDRVARVDSLCRHLLPNGGPQERVLSFPHFVARHGLGDFKRGVLEAADEHLRRTAAGEHAILHAVAL
jgi:bacillithiol biosynthesis cysteine-adding enzyme BshC